MMVAGCGIDIEQHHRFKKYLEEPDHTPFPAFYTTAEIENYTTYQSHLCFALGFSCKESFYKAFGCSWDNSDIDWHDIEFILLAPPGEGRAEVRFHGHALKLANEHKVVMPPTFKYQITGSAIIFESILLCKDN